MPGRERRIVESDFRQRPRPKILDDHVSFRDQPIEYLASARGFEIERHAFLVAVDAEEVGALAFDERRPPRARVVTFAGLFDFDDPRTEVREHHGAVGT